MGRAEALERVIGGGTGKVSLVMFDGSRVGPEDAPVRIEVRSPRACSMAGDGMVNFGVPFVTTLFRN